jgi:hypothetical protein
MTHKGKSLYDDLTPEQIQEVERLASIGCSNKLIAECLGVPVSTFHDCVKLRKICAQKRAEHKTAILSDQSTSRPKNPVMQIWQGKQFLGQTDKQEVKHGVSEETATLLGMIDGASRGLLPSEE